MAMTSIRPAARRLARLAFPAAALVALSLVQAQTQTPPVAFKPTVLHKFAGVNQGGAKPTVPPVLAADGRLYGPTFQGISPVAPSFWGQGGLYGLDAATGSNFRFEVLTGITTASTPVVAKTDGSLLLAGRGLNASNPSSFLTVPALASIKDGKSTLLPAPMVDILGSMALDAAGNAYMGSGDPLSCGTSTTNNRGNTLWRMNADQSHSLVLDFCQYMVEQGSAQLHPKGGAPVASVWSETDQALYVLTGVSASGVADSSMAADNQGRSVGTLIKLGKAAIEEGIASNGKPAADKVELLHTFMRARDGEPTAKGQRIVGMVEAGEWLYGTTQFNSASASLDTTYGGTLWRMKKSDPSSFSVVHYFRGSDTIANDGTPQADGSAPSGPLVLAADGNIYGTTAADGSTMNTPRTGRATPYGAGVLYRIKVGTAADRADDSYEILHRFDLGSEGGKLTGLSLGAVSGGVQKLYGAANAGGDGNPVSTTTTAPGNGTVFSIDVPLPTAAFSQALAASATTATVGSTIQLSWATAQADSCSASGDWSGAQQATASQVPVTVAREGDNTYTLSCTSQNDGQAVSSSVTVTGTAAPVVTPPVVTPPVVDNDSNSGGGGGGPLSAWLLAPLAALAWTRRRASQR